MPGRRSTILYRPSPSVTTVRAFSIRAGLAASTVTPGSTPPDVSLTTPAIPLACCAHVADGNSTTQARATRLAPATLVHAFDIVPPSKVVTLPCASAYTPNQVSPPGQRASGVGGRLTIAQGVVTVVGSSTVIW